MFILSKNINKRSPIEVVEEIKTMIPESIVDEINQVLSGVPDKHNVYNIDIIVDKNIRCMVGR